MNRIQTQLQPSPIQPGSFLVATPSLQDTPFSRTVVFVLQADGQGTFGAVINRPADHEVVAKWSAKTGLEFDRQHMIQGGPLGGPVMALHQQKLLAEVEICEGVCLSVDAKALQHLSRETDSPYRIVLGIAGWNPEQLTQEIKSGFWFPLVVDPIHVFDDHAVMWESFVREYGRQALGSVIGKRHFPADPNLN